VVECLLFFGVFSDHKNLKKRAPLLLCDSVDTLIFAVVCVSVLYGLDLISASGRVSAERPCQHFYRSQEMSLSSSRFVKVFDLSLVILSTPDQLALFADVGDKLAFVLEMLTLLAASFLLEFYRSA
jgi:hypothetical protein